MLTVHAPASSGNLGAGFDALSMTLDLCNEFTAEPASRLEIENLGEGADHLSTGSDNLLYQAIQRAYRACNRSVPPLRLRCLNRIPLSRGLGSSSSAIAAGLLLANRLQGDPLSQDDLLALATEMEGHPDNVVACLLGGIQVSASEGDRVLHCGVPINLPLQAVLFIPDFSMDTHEARRLLPQQVALDDAVFNLSRSALLVAALSAGRADLLRAATEDRLHQPPRTALFPSMPSLFAAARAAGAVGVCLSGAGSTILALALDRAPEIGLALEQTAATHGVGGSVRQVGLRARGAEIFES
jgi:homoserine kinase